MKKSLLIIFFISLSTLVFWTVKKSKNEQLMMEVSHQINDHKEVAIKDEIKIEKKEEDQIQSDHYDLYLNSLPTLEDLKGLTTEEVHHTPEIIKHGAGIVGRIHSEAQGDVSRRVEAMEFFKSCAEDSALATSIRSVCLKKIYTLIPEWKLPIELSEEKISKEVFELAMKLP